MNKQRFTKVLRDPGKLKDEFVELKELRSAFPYAQSIHVLLAILNKNKNSNEAGDALNYAALYVADRHNLREIMENSFPTLSLSSSSLKVEKEEEQIVTEKVPKKAEESTIKTSPEVSKSKNEDSKEPTSEDKSKAQEKIVVKPQGSAKPNIESLSSEGDKMRADLIKNLETLQASKKEWGGEEALEKREHPSEPKESVENIVQTHKQDSEPDNISTKSPRKGKLKSADKQKRNLKSKKAVKPSNKSNKGESPEKIKKQQELISKFIEISPSIKAKANNPPIISSEQEDLSVPSTSFSDGLISENLADILIKQGKLDKAIDIYKKLIWKFPQKKGYFAARIEELSKKKG